MATSGTVTFRPNVEEIINEAYERCEIDIQTRTGYQASLCKKKFKFTIFEWANRGINYWTVQQRTLTLATDTSSYDLHAGVLDLLDVVIYDSADATRTDTIINGITT